MFWFKWFTLDFGTILSIENNSTTSHKICYFSETHKTCCCLINQEKYFLNQTKENYGKTVVISFALGGRWKRRGKDERTGQILKCDELNEFNPKLMKRHGTFLRDQWRIYIVKFWTRAPPGGPNSFNLCSFWENLAKSYIGSPPSPGELAHPPRGNPRFTTGDTCITCSAHTFVVFSMYTVRKYGVFAQNIYLSGCLNL